MLYVNKTSDAISVKQVDEKGNTYWKWVEVNATIDLPVGQGDIYGLSSVVESDKAVVGNVEVETKRVASKEKKPKRVATKKK